MARFNHFKEFSYFMVEKICDGLTSVSDIWISTMHSPYWDPIAGCITTVVIIYSTYKFIDLLVAPYYGTYFTGGKLEQYFESCISPIKPAERDLITYNLFIKETLKRRFISKNVDVEDFRPNYIDEYVYDQKEEIDRYKTLEDLNIPFTDWNNLSEETIQKLQNKEKIINEFFTNQPKVNLQPYIDLFNFKGWTFILKAEELTNNYFLFYYFTQIMIFIIFYLFIYFLLNSFLYKMKLFKLNLILYFMFYYLYTNINWLILAEAKPAQISFQDPATPLAEGIIDIHHHIFFFLVLIFIAVSWVLYKILIHFSLKLNNKKIFLLSHLRLTHHTLLEIIWTIIPSIILYLIAVPSFYLLYSIDEILDPSITLKAIGHQWYWSYEYSDYKIDFDILTFDSYMLPEDELVKGQLRLLEVDNPIVLPVNTHVRLLVTATDVLHCWAVPSLGVKIDAVPGRLNQASIFLKRLGTFYGQCSEICGVNHGFMPIVVKSVYLENYTAWVINKLS